MRTLKLNKNSTIYVCAKDKVINNVLTYKAPVCYKLNLKDSTNQYELQHLGIVDTEAKIGVIPIEMLEELHTGDKVYIRNRVPEKWEGQADNADYEIAKLPSELNFAYIILRKINPNE